MNAEIITIVTVGVALAGVISPSSQHRKPTVPWHNGFNSRRVTPIDTAPHSTDAAPTSCSSHVVQIQQLRNYWNHENEN